MSRPKRDLTRLTINLPTHIVKLLDDFALSNGISRTTAIVILLADSLAERKGD